MEQCDYCADPSIRRWLPTKILADIGQIAKHRTPVVYRKGQVLFYEGHTPYGLFVIQEGQVRLLRKEVVDKKTSTHVPGFAHLVTQTPYCSTCVAETDVKAVFLPRTAIQQYLDQPIA